jgi:two-component system KDP operon response regulator KdpE
MMNNRRISVLVVDDEPRVLRFVRAELESDGYRVLIASNGRQAIELHESERPALVILDLIMPDLDGFEVLRRIRVNARTPVIVLTARGSDVDKIRGLDLGADDYLTKPFGIGELLARIRVALRHNARSESGVSTFTLGAVKVDLARRQVHKNDGEVHLTPIEYKLLATLIKYEGRVITHRQLLKEVWGPGSAEQTQYLRVYMGQLRHKLEDNPSRPRFLTTEPGVGYRLRSE